MLFGMGKNRELAEAGLKTDPGLGIPFNANQFVGSSVSWSTKIIKANYRNSPNARPFCIRRKKYVYMYESQFDKDIPVCYTTREIAGKFILPENPNKLPVDF